MKKFFFINSIKWFKMYIDYILIVIITIFCIFIASIDLYWVFLPGGFYRVDDNVQLSCNDEKCLFSKSLFKIFPSERFAVEEDIDQERFVIKYIYPELFIKH